VGLDIRPPREFVSTGRNTPRAFLIYGLGAPILALFLSGAGLVAAVSIAGVLGDNHAALQTLAGIGLLAGGGELLRRFFQSVRHRIDVDRRSIRGGG